MWRGALVAVWMLGLMGMCSGIPVLDPTLKFAERQTCPLQGIFPASVRTTLGCTTLDELQNKLVETVNRIEFNTGTQVVDDLVEAVMKEAVNNLIDAANTSAGISEDLLGSPLCLGDFDGSEISDEVHLVDSGCDVLPLGEEENWTMVAFNLPAISSICPNLPETERMSMCFAFSLDCNDLPSVSIALNNNLISCLLGSKAALAATGGVSGVLAVGAQAFLDSVSAGVSLSNAFTADREVYTGRNGVETLALKGIYHDRLEMAISRDIFRLPEIISIGGLLERVVSAEGSEQSFTNRIAVFQPGNDDIGQDILNSAKGLNLSVFMRGQIEYAMELEQITKNVLPDIPTQELSEFSAFATSFEQTTALGTRMLPGFYLGANASNPALQVIKELGPAILDALEAPLSFMSIVPGLNLDGEVTELLDNIDELDTDALEFGLALSTEEVQIMFAAALTSAVNLKIECVYDYSRDKFSCKVHAGSVITFLSAAVEIIAGRATWIMRETSDFFESAGEVVAASLVDGAGSAIAFSNKTVQSTAAFLETVFGKLSSELQSWVTSGVVLCGTEIVEDALQCGTEIVTDGLECGFELVTSAAKCGTEFVTSAAQCGTEVVTSGAQCGFDTITSASICGVETIIGCVISLFRDCKRAKTCDVPRTCSVPNSCNVPKTCNVEKTCKIPNSCEVPVAC
ncbi:hypothetical protein NDN08_004867 [Rhodosorus marinus]|uniref:Uncharacterized protein n=1 Tax=Rhodosorus marinus TaxID=101924 RepID=A0AAV8UEV0_9RHOD|nr:hypothetical protein NDN08_004867 [Rhodosorus marinus]